MFELLFSLFIIAFSSFGLKAFLSDGSYVGIFVCGIFIGIGIYIFIKSLIKLIINAITSLKGEECFGAINNILSTGKSINENQIYKAEFIVYIGSEYRTINISEEIGTNPSKYPIGSYVKVKYYNNDINIISEINENNIPEDIRKKIEVDVKKTDEIIDIDGIKYKRMY